LKLETSILAWIGTPVTSNEKMQYYINRVHVRVTRPTSGIFGPPNISRMVEAGDFKFSI